MSATSPPTTATPTRVDGALQHEIEQFLYREADLLDSWQFTAWVELFDDRIRYRMPTRRNVPLRSWAKAAGGETAGVEELSHYDDDKTTLRARIRRLGTPIAWAEVPPTRTRRIIGNVRIAPTGDTGDTGDTAQLAVTSNFIVYSNRRDVTQEIFAGQRRDVLERVEDDWRIQARVILLDQTVLLTDSLSIFF